MESSFDIIYVRFLKAIETSRSILATYAINSILKEHISISSSAANINELLHHSRQDIQFACTIIGLQFACTIIGLRNAGKCFNSSQAKLFNRGKNSAYHKISGNSACMIH
jgi:hypothetical protein